MGFWLDFGEVWSYVWKFIDTPMSIGGYTFSFGNFIILGGIVTIVGKIAYDIIYDKE